MQQQLQQPSLGTGRQKKTTNDFIFKPFLSSFFFFFQLCKLLRNALRAHTVPVIQTHQFGCAVSAHRLGHSDGKQKFLEQLKPFHLLVSMPPPQISSKRKQPYLVFFNAQESFQCFHQSNRLNQYRRTCMKNNSRLGAILKVVLAYYVKLCPISLEVNKHQILFASAMSFHAFLPIFSTISIVYVAQWLHLAAKESKGNDFDKCSFGRHLFMMAQS